MVFVAHSHSSIDSFSLYLPMWNSGSSVDSHPVKIRACHLTERERLMGWGSTESPVVSRGYPPYIRMRITANWLILCVRLCFWFCFLHITTQFWHINHCHNYVSIFNVYLILVWAIDRILKTARLGKCADNRHVQFSHKCYYEYCIPIRYTIWKKSHSPNSSLNIWSIRILTFRLFFCFIISWLPSILILATYRQKEK